MHARVIKIQDSGSRGVAATSLTLHTVRRRWRRRRDQRRCAPSFTLLHKSDNDLEVFTVGGGNHIQASVPWFIHRIKAGKQWPSI